MDTTNRMTATPLVPHRVITRRWFVTRAPQLETRSASAKELGGKFETGKNRVIQVLETNQISETKNSASASLAFHKFLEFQLSLLDDAHPHN